MDAELQKFLKRAGWKQSGENWKSGGRLFSLNVEEVPGSWDRTLAPFLSKAILEARAKAKDAEPVAVLKVRRATPLADERLRQFVGQVSSEQSWILIDGEGRIFPHVAAAPELREEASARVVAPAPPVVKRSMPLFTDLNQWMIKVLLAPFIEERLLTAPRRPLRNASTLAEAADVSVPAASRFLSALEEESQLDRRFGDLRISRPLELLTKWREQTAQLVRHELAVVAVRGLNLDDLFYEGVVLESPRRTEFVLAIHRACDELGLGHVRGAIPVLWSQSLAGEALGSYGLVPATTDKVDVILRTPRFPASLYRGMVRPRGKPTTDILQCWLDCSHYRIRGQEQADYIWRKVFMKAFDS